MWLLILLRATSDIQWVWLLTMYGQNRHTHQSSRLQTIIYNVICNSFIYRSNISFALQVQTFYIRIDCTFIMYESVPLNNSMLSDVHRFQYTLKCAMCIHGSCYWYGMKCILYVSISLSLPSLLCSLLLDALWL